MNEQEMISKIKRFTISERLHMVEGLINDMCSESKPKRMKYQEYTQQQFISQTLKDAAEYLSTVKGDND